MLRLKSKSERDRCNKQQWYVHQARIQGEYGWAVITSGGVSKKGGEKLIIYGEIFEHHHRWMIYTKRISALYVLLFSLLLQLNIYYIYYVVFFYPYSIYLLYL